MINFVSTEMTSLVRTLQLHRYYLFYLNIEAAAVEVQRDLNQMSNKEHDYGRVQMVLLINVFLLINGCSYYTF